jgi:kynurenine formamidase
MTTRPRYDDLDVIEGTDIKKAWGLFGELDELGALNLITEDVSHAALASARTGQSFALQLPLDMPGPPLFGRERFGQHHEVGPNSIDDRLDGLYPQGSSQWDALGHALHPAAGAYNGFTSDDIIQDGRLGIDRVAERGIVTRGVLLDMPAFHRALGEAWDPTTRIEIDADLIERAAAWAGVTLREGDVLCVRTGWVEYYKSLTPEASEALAQDSLRLAFSCPGLAPAAGIARLVWDSGIVAVALDNPGAEPFMPPMLEDFSGVMADELVHNRLTVALGVMLGELWDFDALAGACAADERYDFLLVSVPLRVPGGVGSPSNAIAIR